MCAQCIAYLIAQKCYTLNPDKKVVHFGIGFETTAVPTACELQNAPKNFLVLSAHRLFPPAMQFLLESGDVDLHGFLNPGHVSAIIGTKPYQKILDRYIIPLTVMGGLTVGILAALADLSGALSRGTGILLTVMIIYKLYEDIARQHMYDMNPMMRKFMGK